MKVLKVKEATENIPLRFLACIIAGKKGKASILLKFVGLYNIFTECAL